jgi:hypothetical protein
MGWDWRRIMSKKSWTQVRIEPKHQKRLGEWSAKTGIPITKLVEIALEMYIKEQESAGKIEFALSGPSHTAAPFVPVKEASTSTARADAQSAPRGERHAKSGGCEMAASS